MAFGMNMPPPSTETVIGTKSDQGLVGLEPRADGHQHGADRHRDRADRHHAPRAETPGEPPGQEVAGDVAQADDGDEQAVVAGRAAHLGDDDERHAGDEGKPARRVQREGDRECQKVALAQQGVVGADQRGRRRKGALGDMFVSGRRSQVARNTNSVGSRSSRKPARQPQWSLMNPPAAGEASEQITIAMVM